MDHLTGPCDLPCGMWIVRCQAGGKAEMYVVTQMRRVSIGEDLEAWRVA